jgi:Ankyrin repeats (many copies)
VLLSLLLLLLFSRHGARDLVMSTDLFAAIAERQALEVIQEMVRDDPGLIREKDGCHGWLPLHYAARIQVKVDLLRYLVDTYPAALLERDKEGRLPLQPSVVLYLYKYGCRRRSLYDSN